MREASTRTGLILPHFRHAGIGRCDNAFNIRLKLRQAQELIMTRRQIASFQSEPFAIRIELGRHVAGRGEEGLAVVTWEDGLGYEGILYFNRQILACIRG